MKKIFYSLLRITYAIVWLVILGILIFSKDIVYSCRREFLLPNSMLFCLVIGVILFVIILINLINKRQGVINTCDLSVTMDKIMLTITFLLFIAQCYVFYSIFFLSDWDAGVVRNCVDIFLNKGNNNGANFYFSRYPNNLLITYLYVFIQKVNRHIGIFPGEYSYMSVVIVNCAINSFACFLSYKTAKIFTSSVFAVLTYLLCICSFGISGWTVICYSDSIALIFPILSVYLYCKKYKSEKMKIVGSALAGIISVIGYFIKPQCLFALIAIILIELVKLVGKNSLNSFVYLGVLCVTSIIVFSTMNMGINSLNDRYNVKIDKSQTFGITHFLMMGANEETNGVYSQEDVDFSGAYATSEERSRANVDVFIDRIADMKTNIFDHLKRKILTTFNDGTFAWGGEGKFFYYFPAEINQGMSRYLKSLYCGDKLLYLATIQHFFWLLIMSCSIIAVVKNKEKVYPYELIVFWIILLGFFVYEMLFEARARYIYIFVPLLCTLSTIGIEILAVRVYESHSKIKRELERINKK